MCGKMASELRVACQCVLASPKQIVHQNSAYVSRIDHHDRQKVEMSRLEEAENKKNKTTHHYDLFLAN